MEADLVDILDGKSLLPKRRYRPDNHIVGRIALRHRGGGLREGVWYGVPLVAVPQTYEQEILSIQMMAQGAGIVVLPTEVSRANLQTATRTALFSPTYRENSARLGAACRAAGGAKRAADAILGIA